VEKEGLIAIGLEGWRRSRRLEITKKGRSRLPDHRRRWIRTIDRREGAGLYCGGELGVSTGKPKNSAGTDGSGQLKGLGRAFDLSFI
jgi:hypothetical protein